MVLMVYISMIYGLITRHDLTSENGGIFLAALAAHTPNAIVFSAFSSKMILAKQPNGMYARSAKHLQRSVSHDEITGMLATSKIFNTSHRFEIWKQLKSNFGAYPAIVMGNSDYLPFNPANYYAWGQYVDSKISYLFLPFYIINLIIASNKNKSETSSKLIYNLELTTMPKNAVNKALLSYFEKKMKSQYGEKYLLELRKIYFAGETSDFPLLKVLE
jgi:hypothetical protein